jgi:hypothetical protein
MDFAPIALVLPVMFLRLAAGNAAAGSLEGTASGSLTIAGKTTPLTYAYARAEKGFFDPSKEDIRVILTDVPLSDEELADESARSRLAEAGKLHSVEVVINAEKQPIAGVLRHAAFSRTQGFVSVSGMHKFEPKTFDGRFVEGRLSTETLSEFMNVTFAYAATLRAAVWRRPPPTASGGTARKTEPARAVLAFFQAARAGHRAAVRKLLTAAASKALDGPRGKEMFEFVKSTSPDPATAEIESVDINDNAAVVTVVEKSKDGSSTSRWNLVLEGGRWKVGL